MFGPPPLSPAEPPWPTAAAWTVSPVALEMPSYCLPYRTPATAARAAPACAHAALHQPAAPETEDAEAHTFELSSEWVALFARMEMRKNGRSKAREQGRCASERRMELPEQENETSRAVMAERAQERVLQERRYGAHAAIVRMLEADLNQSFDSIAHGELPVLWPSVPLRAG